ncbi:hypothetical protein E2C01_064564 [Portunus trituberculatus]|uniref:Uncharacterized protein n=1 Tax=Portunus trituberculatus TaxID=210409 RepID=A0A5B7HDC4_PORTR|nr:hypothetical protein [Portunus trituberculatus]
MIKSPPFTAASSAMENQSLARSTAFISNVSCAEWPGSVGWECHLSTGQMTVVQAALRARPVATDEGLGCLKLWAQPSRVTLPLQEKSRGKWLC